MLHFYQKIIEIGAPGRVLELFEVGTKNLKIFGIFQKSFRTERLLTMKKYFFPPKLPKNGQFCFKSQFYDKMGEKNIIWGIFGVMTIYQSLQLTHSVRITHICVKKAKMTSSQKMMNISKSVDFLGNFYCIF